MTDRTNDHLAGAKKILAFKVGGTWRFSRADIDEWIRRQSTEGIAEPLGDAQGDDQSGGSAGKPG